MTESDSLSDQFSDQRAQILKNLSQELSRIGNSVAFRYYKTSSAADADSPECAYSVFGSRNTAANQTGSR